MLVLSLPLSLVDTTLPFEKIQAFLDKYVGPDSQRIASVEMQKIILEYAQTLILQLK